MTFEQTVEIPENRCLAIEIPREFPTGAAIFTFTPKPAYPADKTARTSLNEAALKEAIEKCKGIAKGILSSDEIIAMRRKDKELEDAQFRRLFSLDEDKV
ncbi:MAG: hypothetical protein LBK66_11705 [Spirochaetaceae bacterium]|jgi:hypothetical protein|nr:hypothetical protein [Spirochaetaceae bacterium]